MLKKIEFEILPTSIALFDSYNNELTIDIDSAFQQVKAKIFTAENFKFYTSVSAIASSKIEGEELEIDSYIKHKMQNVAYLPNLTQKPNDLFEAYIFAQENSLTKENFYKAHDLISQHLLPPNQRGCCRKNEMLILEHKSGRIQYEAAPMSIVAAEFDKLWHDIELLVKKSLGTKEVFYYASLIHLVFEKIHPFNDGNGRAGRLLEKWFLAEMLGEKSWCIASEKYYYQNVERYYENLSVTGMFYEKFDHQKSISFLLMLPQALTFENLGV